MAINGNPTDNLPLLVPAGVTDGQTLLVVGIALSFPNSGGAGGCPGAGQIITPPAGWDVVLADGEVVMGDTNCVRIAVFTKEVGAAEPNPTFTWVPSGPAVNCGFIFGVDGPGPGIMPELDVAAVAPTTTNAPGNPMDVDAPSIVTTVDDALLLCMFAARNASGDNHSIPAGMSAPPFPVVGIRGPGDESNVQAELSPPLGISLVIEQRPNAGPTGVRTSQITQAGGELTRALGYSFALRAPGGGGETVGPLEIYARFH